MRGQGQRHREGGGRGSHTPPYFWVAKRKKWRQRQKREKVWKQKLLKDCHQGQSIIVLAILERLELKIFSCRTTIVKGNTFQCFMLSIQFDIHFETTGNNAFLKSASIHLSSKLSLCQGNVNYYKGVHHPISALLAGKREHSGHF